MLRFGVATLALGLLAFPASGQDTTTATPTPPVPPTALEQRRDEAVIRAAIAKAESEEAASRASMLPKPPTVGATTASEGAGEPEAMILATLQVQFAAADIVQQLGATFDTNSHPTFVAAGSTLPSVAEAEAFDLRTDALEAFLSRASEIEIAIPEPRRSNLMAVEAGQGFLPISTLTTIAASAISWLQTTTTVGGVALTKTEDATLVSAFLWAGGGRLQPLDGVRISTETSRAVTGRLDALARLRGLLEVPRGNCAIMRARIDAKKDDAKTALEALYAGALVSCGQVDAAITAYDAFTSTYKAGDGDRLQLVLAQKEITRRIGTGMVLLVAIPRQEAAAYTQTNVFSALGAIPYHVTAATDLHWRLVKNDGSLVRAGFGSRYSGYQPISEVDRLVNREGRASERRHRRILGQSSPADRALPTLGCWAQSAAGPPAGCPRPQPSHAEANQD